MNIQLSDHFTVKKLIRFVFPSVIMMVFSSIYGVVDGFFVSNYAGKTPFAAVNLIMPFIMVIGTLGFMIGTGGSALVSKTFGEGDKKKANELFSMLIYFVLIVGTVLSVIGAIVSKRVALLLGADSEMLDYCVLYARISFISMPFFMLQNVFQSFLVTAEKPNLGLVVTLVAGINNMVLDFLFVGVFKWGIVGAATATVISEYLGGGIPLIYFAFKNSSTLRLGKTHYDGMALLKVCTNGASELMTNLSMSFLNMVYNFQLMKYFGENGIVTYGVIMYVNFTFLSIFIGYSIGVAPIVGYSYGAKNHDELKNLLKKSTVFIAFTGMIMFAVALLFSPTLAKLFTGYDEELYKLTKYAFRLFSTSYLLSGFNIFGSAFFTALNNGKISAAVSFSRMLLFQLSAVMLLPMIFGVNSIWISVTVAEACTFAVLIFFIVKNNKRYRYY